MMGKFATGRVMMTSGVSSMIESDSAFGSFVKQSFDRYVECDWGDTCKEDSAMNDAAVDGSGDRVLAVYNYASNDGVVTTIWIITECDHSVTTVLFPFEY